MLGKIIDRLDTASVLAFGLVGTLLTIAVILVLRSPDNDMTKIVIGGLLTVGFASVIGFYFGSSKGSEKKDDTMASITKTVAKTAETTATTAATTANTAAATLTPPSNGLVEAATWNDTAAANTLEAYENYVSKFPNGVHTSEAKYNISKIKGG